MNIVRYFQYIAEVGDACLENNLNTSEYIQQLVLRDKKEVLRLIAMKRKIGVLNSGYEENKLAGLKFLSEFNSFQTIILMSIISDIDDVISPLKSHIPVFSLNSNNYQPANMGT